jgi:uncharacterized protein (DUF302 family)
MIICRAASFDGRGIVKLSSFAGCGSGIPWGGAASLRVLLEAAPRGSIGPSRGGSVQHRGVSTTGDDTMIEDRTANVPDSVTKLSPRSVADTVSRLIDMIAARGMKLFAVIDQSAEARQAGLELRDTTLVIFGSPAAGTPVMVASPLAALDLPLKVVVWDDAGQTKVSYDAPAALAARHRLSAEQAAPLAGIDALTDALAAP